MKISGTPCLINENQEYTTLRRSRFGDHDFSEDFLQATLHTCPQLLPVEEFHPSFGPLVSLGREIDNIDNLFLSPSGQLTIVETKLWRNPEATREVVAQILDYATRVAAWSYSDLEEKFKKYHQPSSPAMGTQSLYDFVSSFYENENLNEMEFVDSVTSCLKNGRFLLLIVGDGIKEGLDVLLNTIQPHPQMQFTLGLVELRIFQHPTQALGRLVVPHIVAKTMEVERAVVRVITTGPGQTEVKVG